MKDFKKDQIVFIIWKYTPINIDSIMIAKVKDVYTHSDGKSSSIEIYEGDAWHEDRVFTNFHDAINELTSQLEYEKREASHMINKLNNMTPDDVYNAKTLF